jgi:hypothetical protein
LDRGFIELDRHGDAVQSDGHADVLRRTLSRKTHSLVYLAIMRVLPLQPVSKMNLSWLQELPTPIRAGDLSPTARRGFELARALDLHYRGMHGWGIRQLANYHRVHPATIRRWINTAARQLSREPEGCVVCGQPHPRGARRSRRYCDEHGSVLARVHRHRGRAG